MPKRPAGEEAIEAPDDEAAEATPGGDAAEPEVRAKLEPIGTVRRELIRPDGTKVAVDVPIYPPFRLDDAAAAAAKPKGKQPPRRVRPGAKPRPTGSD
jgi:hypothetical protein